MKLTVIPIAISTRCQNIKKIGKNSENSPEDSWRVAVIQTLVENHLLTLVWKTLKGVIIIMTQQNSKFSLRGDKKQNYQCYNKQMLQISAKRYKSRHKCAGKVIHGELCKKMKSEFTTEQFMQKTEFILENEMHEILGDFEIKTYNLISVRR